jgi:hypothetical protein
MGEVMDAVNGLARLASVAVLALHHTPKAVRQVGSSDSVRGAGNIVNAVRIASTIFAADDTDAQLYGFGEGFKARYVRVDDAKANAAAIETRPTWLEKQSFPLPNGDTSYSLRIVTASATATGEALLIAAVLATYMDRIGSVHLDTHGAAKVLTEAEPHFRERVPASGSLTQIKALIELRLAEPVKVDGGATVRVMSYTAPGGDSVRRLVTLS